MKDQDLTNSVAFVGGGNMATAIIGGLQQHGSQLSDFVVIEPSADKRTALHQAYGVSVSDNALAATQKSVIVLAVKPQHLQAVCETIRPNIKDQVVISIAAGIRTTSLANWLGNHTKIIRVMPNTPAQIQAGISALYALPEVSEIEQHAAQALMQAVGQTVWVADETQMDAVTAISGSGPAYVFYCIEALQEAGVNLGLSSEQASKLALQTFLGASKLAATSDESVATLREKVTSKGGTTEKGLAVLADKDIKAIFDQAAQAAAEQSVILGNKLSQS